MNNVSEIKQMARKAAFSRRKSAFSEGHEPDANRHLIGHLARFKDANIIAGYMPIRTELSPIATMTILHGQEKRICVPVIVGADQALRFQEWTPDCDMIEGPFGAAVPKDTPILQPDILITPLVAFDGLGYRLGYGGGFYDRSFEELAALKPIQAVGFAYGAQECEEVPREETDYRLNAVVTELGVTEF